MAVYTTRFILANISAGSYSATYTVPSTATGSIKSFSVSGGGSGDPIAVLLVNGVAIDGIAAGGIYQGDAHQLTVGLAGGDTVQVYAANVDCSVQVSGFLFT